MIKIERIVEGKGFTVEYQSPTKEFLSAEQLAKQTNEFEYVGSLVDTADGNYEYQGVVKRNGVLYSKYSGSGYQGDMSATFVAVKNKGVLLPAEMYPFWINVLCLDGEATNTFRYATVKGALRTWRKMSKDLRGYCDHNIPKEFITD